MRTQADLGCDAAFSLRLPREQLKTIKELMPTIRKRNPEARGRSGAIRELLRLGAAVLQQGTPR